MLKNCKIGLFITGGIASYKMAELSRQLIKKGAIVRVAMTESAMQFIQPLTLQILTKHEVLIDTFDETNPASVQHIEMADWLDVALVAPATANILGKMANGIADDVVSTTLMAVNQPRIIIPAMNTKMWENAATVRNVAQLKMDGAHVMSPSTGFLAEGYEGKGRMPELENIVQYVESIVAKKKYSSILENRRVLITAGGTIERIDPVRYISNASSGKMGYALAEAAYALGAEVYLISTKPELKHSDGINVEYVESAQAMHEAILKQFSKTDMVIMAAAVSDYRVQNQSEHKIKKDAGAPMTLQLVENDDILADLGKKKQHQQIIGFAAETQNLLENAKSKLQRKKADWIIANDVSNPTTGFDSNENLVTLLSKDGDYITLPQMPKTELAYHILLAIVNKEITD